MTPPHSTYVGTHPNPKPQDEAQGLRLQLAELQSATRLGDLGEATQRQALMERAKALGEEYLHLEK